MRLYRALGPRGYVWFGTQTDAKAGARQIGAADYDQVEVPTDKPGLLDWLNKQAIMGNGLKTTLEAAEDEEHDFLAAAEQRAVRASVPDTRPLEADGHPEHRSAYTVAQVAASALPKAMVVQDVCHAVAKMRAPDLGYVALEVMARAAKLGGVPGVGSDSEAQG
jgi:hypothetical protein